MNLTELHKRVLTAVILLPIVVFMILFNQSLFNLLLILILLISFYEWYNFNKKKISIPTMSGYLIIFLAISFAYFLRGNDNESKIVFLWIVFVCFFSDIGGFCFGKIIGGKKITKISRNKTYAGICGSFIFSTFQFFHGSPCCSMIKNKRSMSFGSFIFDGFGVKSTSFSQMTAGDGCGW